MIKKILGIGTGVVLILSLVFNLVFWQKNQRLVNGNLVSRVIDGDTLVIKSGQTLRLINVEAPELKFCGGPEAQKKLQKLILGKIISYEIVTHDIYNRPLALVYLGEMLINKIILQEGWAKYDGTPSPKREEIKLGFDEAVKNKRGIFSLCLAEKPDNPKCLIKGNIDRHRPDEKTYYFPGCANYKQTMVEKDLGEDWFCSETEAEKAGFVKSTNCYGKSYSD